MYWIETTKRVFTFVMDNAPIHAPAKVRHLVEGRHYRYLPPYSPFLNPTEEFWSKVKAGVRRNALTADDQLNDVIPRPIRCKRGVDQRRSLQHGSTSHRDAQKRPLVGQRVAGRVCRFGAVQCDELKGEHRLVRSGVGGRRMRLRAVSANCDAGRAAQPQPP